MSMFDDIEYWRRLCANSSIQNARDVASFGTRFTIGHWRYIGPAEKRIWWSLNPHGSERKWCRRATGMVNMFKIGSSGTRCSFAEPLWRGDLITRSGKRSIHLHATNFNKRVLINAILAYNLWCICSEMCLWIVRRNTATPSEIE